MHSDLAPRYVPEMLGWAGALSGIVLVAIAIIASFAIATSRPGSTPGTTQSLGSSRPLHVPNATSLRAVGVTGAALR
jgi:hypothetical protein